MLSLPPVAVEVLHPPKHLVLFPFSEDAAFHLCVGANQACREVSRQKRRNLENKLLWRAIIALARGLNKQYKMWIFSCHMAVFNGWALQRSVSGLLGGRCDGENHSRSHSAL